jgi:ketosteroid isomerase-like protein
LRSVESSLSPGSKRIAVVERGIRLWNNRAWEAALTELDPDVEWRTSGVVPGLEQVYHGHDGVMRFWRSWTEAWDEIQIDTEELTERGDDVFVVARFRARGRDGMEVDQPVAFQFTTGDTGLLTRFQAYWNRDDAPLDARTSETGSESR